MKKHNPNYNEKSLEIKQVVNGFIVKYKSNTYQLEERVFINFNDVVHFVSGEFGLLNIGEKTFLAGSHDGK